MTKQNTFYLIIITLLLFVIGVQKCSDGGSKNPPTVTTTSITDTFYATKIREIPKYVPVWKERIVPFPFPVHDTILSVDTSYIIEDYFSTYVYIDSLSSDSLNICIIDSITQNKIKSRALSYKMHYPIITNTITNTIISNKNEFYLGLGLTSGQTGIKYAGTELMLRTKQKNMYGLGIGIDDDLKPNLSVRTYWKLGKK